MQSNIFHRDGALQPLSRDHGVLLVLAERIQYAAMAVGRDCMRLAEQIHGELAEPVLRYLADEDLALSRIQMNKSIKDKIRRDHTDIAQLIEAIPAKLLDEWRLRRHLHALATLIELHTRWDEHVLFPYIQEAAGQDELKALQRCTQRMELQRNRPTQQLHSSIWQKKQ